MPTPPWYLQVLSTLQQTKLSTLTIIFPWNRDKNPVVKDIVDWYRLDRALESLAALEELRELRIQLEDDGPRVSPSFREEVVHKVRGRLSCLRETTRLSVVFPSGQESEV